MMSKWLFADSNVEHYHYYLCNIVFPVIMARINEAGINRSKHHSIYTVIPVTFWNIFNDGKATVNVTN